MISNSLRVGLTVVIVHYKATEHLRSCLRSLCDKNCKVIVVDNHSQDGSENMLRGEFPHVNLICNDENLGFAKACNQGVQLADTPYILLLNPDTLVLPEALDKLVSFMDGHPQAAAAGPRLLNQDGTVQHSAYNFPGYVWVPAHFSRLGPWFRAVPFFRKALQRFLLYFIQEAKMIEVDWVTGACLLLRREALAEVGLLDESFFLFFEEIDWCRRAGEKGWKVYYFPEAEVVHFLAKSAEKNPDVAYLERYRSMLYFYKKHYGTWGFLWCKFWMTFFFGLRWFRAWLLRLPEHSLHFKVLRMALLAD